MWAAKKDDDYDECTLPLAQPCNGKSSSLSQTSSSARHRLYLRLLVLCGAIAAVCGLVGIALLSAEFESGNDIANRLDILVPKVLAVETHKAFNAAKVIPSSRARRRVVLA